MRLFSAFLLSLLSVCACAQVAKRVVVEHFTNTVCAICAGKNPGFYETLEGFPDIIHLAIHPSAPYDNCLFNEYNPGENDARTHFYGIYGGTPRLVVQGEVVPVAAGISNASLLSAHEGEMADYEMKIVQEYPSSLDSLRIEVNISRVAVSQETTARLYAVLAESKVRYEAPNGETIHRDVFRKSLFGADGLVVELPAAVNTSKTYTATTALDTRWNRDQLYAMALIQNKDSNDVLQAVSAEGEMITYAAGVKGWEELRLYPNPAGDYLYVAVDTPGKTTVKLINTLGETVLIHRDARALIFLGLGGLPPGCYVAEVSDGTRVHRATIVVQ